MCHTLTELTTVLPATKELTRRSSGAPIPESRQGWEKTEEGVLEPVWSCGSILPPSLVDLLEKTAEEMEDVTDEEGQEIEYEELLSDDE